ncbi:uncharacterized protein LOC132707639 [Cylas formicarius]|uniref:uncharacterized protein LOC132707639 n=1 Tax=Cylas formicarius TaxID=197179 RepID=UPI0029586FAE|nr:uncharacterized protein LOC132707639 [Cylas formicarius]
MESPPSSSSWSQAFILSDDSGLLLTNGSASSWSTSFESRSDKRHFHFEDSDCEEKSLSQDDSLDGMSDIMCGENFNTLKKGPHWTEVKQSTSPIDPPPEFQDNPKYPLIELFCNKLSLQILMRAMLDFREAQLQKSINCRRSPFPSPVRNSYAIPNRTRHLSTRPTYFVSEFVPFSPCHAHHHTTRPNSRSSLGGSSRLSSSHNSLSLPTTCKVDDSTFITQAVSHDTLSSNQISDLYNVPFDSDMYAVPVDVVRPPLKPRRGVIVAGGAKKRRRNTSSGCREAEMKGQAPEPRKSIREIGSGRKSVARSEQSHWCFQSETKRHSLAGTSATHSTEPIHMTLQEVRHYLQTLYSSSSDSSDTKENPYRPKTNSALVVANNKYHTRSMGCNLNNQPSNRKKATFLINIKNKKVKDSCENPKALISASKKEEKKRRLFGFKQALCNIFRFRRFLSSEVKTDNVSQGQGGGGDDPRNSLGGRALPPLPNHKDENIDHELGATPEGEALDFATSIQRVKDYGWYWGPISSEAAEKILSNEPDGSFIVRDSSDDHYIFSLTLKLNNCVRHVRIEHDQGNFSFGSCTKFKSQTIVEFIENAVEHSRSGRYLFFLHRRPVIGPVRVQLLHPVSRFKQVQSLQHMCRFVIHKNVRRDLIPDLPLPRRMIDYLNTPHYYSEHFVDVPEASNEEAPPPSERTPSDFASTRANNVRIVSNPIVPVNDYVELNNNSNSNGGVANNVARGQS